MVSKNEKIAIRLSRHGQTAEFRGKALSRSKYLPPAAQLKRTPYERRKNEHLFLGSFSKIEGREYYICPLLANQKYDRSYYSKSASSVRNYLYFNHFDSSSRWLLEPNNWLINDKRAIYQNFNEDKKDITNGFFYEIVKKDTNGDGVLNYNDRKSIYYSNFDGTNLTVVIEETTDILGINQIDDNKSVIFHRNGIKSQATFVDNSTGNIIEESDLPIKS